METVTDNSTVTFVGAELVERHVLGFRCRVNGRVVFVGPFQWRQGTDVLVGGDRLVLDVDDARTLGLLLPEQG
jgi:hypothetical protein